jgi:hypothetical protein
MNAAMMVEDARKEQRQKALGRANTVRTKRAEIKRQMAEGELTLAELLYDPPAEVRNAEIGQVLEWAPGIGKYRASRILAGGPGSPGCGRMVHIENLSQATRERILDRLEEWVPYRYATCG